MHTYIKTRMHARAQVNDAYNELLVEEEDYEGLNHSISQVRGVVSVK